jgi:hypothetical protein
MAAPDRSTRVAGVGPGMALVDLSRLVPAIAALPSSQDFGPFVEAVGQLIDSAEVAGRDDSDDPAVSRDVAHRFGVVLAVADVFARDCVARALAARNYPRADLA